MCRERDRLKIFEKWSIEYINPNDLAATGFYYYLIELRGYNYLLLILRYTLRLTVLSFCCQD